MSDAAVLFPSKHVSRCKTVVFDIIENRSRGKKYSQYGIRKTDCRMNKISGILDEGGISRYLPVKLKFDVT